MLDKNDPLANRKKTSELSQRTTASQKKKDLSHFQNEFAEALTSGDQHLKEVKLFVERLKNMASQFEEAGSATRRQFSLQVKYDALQAEIKNALQLKAEAQVKAGMPEEQNLMICQAFVDDVLIYLAKDGIRLNPLNVMKVPRTKYA